MSTHPSIVPRQQLSATVFILGVRVDRISQARALEWMMEIMAQQRASETRTLCRQVITVNPEFVMAAQHNAAFRQAINAAALVVADGIGVVWAARHLKAPLPERITGVDTLLALAGRCAAAGYRIYLLGAAPGVAAEAAARLCQLAPGLQIAGTYAGSPAPAEEEEIIERIRAARADLLCVAYGAPSQDLWISRNLPRLPAALAIGVGGAYDFISGRQQRAPRLMQRLGVEWLYRLYREPWRWRRMLALPRFVCNVIVKGRTQDGN
jgi:N-acetylglucosaminyldiphosphoundecaprenol N-acetyl-beta-D-mannosaminyltransferase